MFLDKGFVFECSLVDGTVWFDPNDVRCHCASLSKEDKHL